MADATVQIDRIDAETIQVPIIGSRYDHLTEFWEMIHRESA